MQTAQFELHADIEERHWWFVARRRILRRVIREVLPPSPDALILGVGCGTGANLAALGSDYECLGIDTSEEAVELARRRFPGMRFLVGKAPDELGELMRRAKLVLLADVLEHLQDDFWLLSSLLAAASPGCHFLITVPADEALWTQHDESFGHFRRYDRRRLAKTWEGLDVQPLLLSHFNSRLLPVIRWVRRRNRRRHRAAGQAGTDFWLPSPPVNAVLTWTLSGEAGRLLRALRTGEQAGYNEGASLIALLRRGASTIASRSKPADLPPDHGQLPQLDRCVNG
jgi:SAM-dependent methyltransferase